MKNKAKRLELFVHGIFLILGLITVAAVLLISVYLIVSGIPAIKEIGFFDFEHEEHEVKSISINGEEDFTAEQVFPSDATIIIIYWY